MASIISSVTVYALSSLIGKEVITRVIKETANSFDNLLTRLDEVIQYLKNVKVDKDSNEIEQ